MLVKNWPCGCLICTDVRLRRNDDVQQPDQSKVTVPLVCMGSALESKFYGSFNLDDSIMYYDHPCL